MKDRAPWIVLLLLLAAAGRLALSYGPLAHRRTAPQPAAPAPKPPAPTVPEPAEPPRHAPPPVAPQGGEVSILLDGVRVSLDTFLAALGRAIVFHDQAWLDALGKKKLEIEGDYLPALLAIARGPAMLFARVAAVDLLGRMEARDAVPALAEVIASREPFLQEAALRALARIATPPAIEAIASALPAMLDPGLRVRAARALAQAGGEAAYAALLALLTDPDERVRAEASLALGRRGDARAVGPLVAAATVAQHPETLIAALSAAFTLDGRALGSAQVADLLDRRPEARREIERRIRPQAADARFTANYPSGFFDDGGLPVRFEEGEEARIGILVDPGRNGMDVGSIAARIFAKAPFDRYREFFYLRMSSEYEEDLSRGAPQPRAYDTRGTFLSSGMPVSILDATFVLRFTTADQLMPGVSGVTRGHEAEVTLDSLLHEIGHAFAELADEYDSLRAGDLGGANLELREAGMLKWQGLVDRGVLPQGRFPRRQMAEGNDIGKCDVPSGDCFMNNHPADGRYCPVCQLEIIERVCRLTGAARPW